MNRNVQPRWGASPLVEGGVERQTSDGQWHPAAIEELLCAGDSVRTGQFSRAAIALTNDFRTPPGSGNHAAGG